MNTGKLPDMAKRGYSREFTPRSRTKASRRRFEVDWIPVVLYNAVKAKAKKQGISLRALTLQLWQGWLGDGRDES